MNTCILDMLMVCHGHWLSVDLPIVKKHILLCVFLLQSVALLISCILQLVVTFSEGVVQIHEGVFFKYGTSIVGSASCQCPPCFGHFL